jgi:hypothetical protein
MRTHPDIGLTTTLLQLVFRSATISDMFFVYLILESTSSIIPFIVLGVGVSTLALAILILLIWYKRQGRTICNVRLRKVPLR